MSANARDEHRTRDPDDDVADRADYDPTYDPDAPIACDVCGNIMDYTATCRITCRNCGYTRDCEDP